MAGYWIVRAGATKDAEALRAYGEIWARVAPRFGAEIFAGRGRVETPEGAQYPRQFIIRFASFEQAVACYEDPEYQASLPFAALAYDRDLSILEGT